VLKIIIDHECVLLIETEHISRVGKYIRIAIKDASLKSLDHCLGRSNKERRYYFNHLIIYSAE
jgi:hypothetical protein